MKSTRHWLTLMMSAALVCAPIGGGTAGLQGICAASVVSVAYAEEAAETPQNSAAPQETAEPQQTARPQETAAPQETPAPSEPVETPIDTATPQTPEATVTPEIAETPAPDESPEASVSPEAPEETAPEPVQNAAISLARFYFKAEKEAVPGQRMTLELVLRADLPDGSTLRPFGVRVEAGGEMQVEALSGATYADGIMWVKQGQVEDGRVIAGGSRLTLTLSFVPFSDTDTAEETTVTWKLLDENGQTVGLTDCSDDVRRIRHALTIARKAPEAAKSPVAEPAESQEEAPADAEQPQETAAAEEPPVADEEPPVGDEAATSSEQPLSNETSDQPETVTDTELQPPVEQAAYLEHNIAPGDLRVGDTLVLAARLVGFDGVEMRFQWQHCHGGVWSDVPNAQDATFTVEITEENLRDSWRYEADPV